MFKELSNRISPIIKVITINLAIGFLLLEGIGRAFAYTKTKLKKLPQDMGQYYSFVNHGHAYPAVHKPLVTPSNVGPETKIFSRFDCSSKSPCKNLILQGDSWAELLGVQAIDIFLSITDLNIIAGGTSSFSPSNMAGQLAYLSQVKKISPDIVIAFVDQTDIGDEFCRYKDQLIFPTSKDPFLRVRPFDSNRQYEHYAANPLSTARYTDSYAIAFIKEIIYRVNRYMMLNLKISPASSPCEVHKDILSPLTEDSIKDEKEHFFNVLNHYVNTASIVGAKQLIFVTHPHQRHLISGNLAYKQNVSDLIDQFLLINPDLVNNEKLVINHFKLTPPKDWRDTNYFRKNDVTSHLTFSGYRLIANQIVSRLKSLR